ncbi:MAG: hypothetical protein K0R05_3179 [Anaerocolumna sp.]|jgi:GT2 family glycosyltransferase|nr:hypothetical protein [Anaerocolumna sp.]
MKTRLAVIILHYKNYKETIDCINSALKQKGSGYEIVVVDNGSGDSSFMKIKKEFAGTAHITLKSLKTNTGFARGNNAGIRYARTYLGAENCFVCNSDIIFEESLFEELLSASVKGVGIISPAVYDTEFHPQPISVNTRNPYTSMVFSFLYIHYQSVIDRIKEGLHELPFLPISFSHITSSVSSPVTMMKAEAKQNTYCLQGCAFLLTKEFFRHYDKLYPKTFLYGEELNLAIYLKKAGLKGIIADTSPVIHKGGRSSYMQNNKERLLIRSKLAKNSLLRSLPLLLLPYAKIRRI